MPKTRSKKHKDYRMARIVYNHWHKNPFIYLFGYPLQSRKINKLIKTRSVIIKIVRMNFAKEIGKPIFENK